MPRGFTASKARSISCLSARSSNTASITTSTAANPRPVGRGGDQPELLVPLQPVERPALHPLVQPGPHGGQRPGPRGVVALADADRQAGLVGGDAGDAAPHQPAAQHPHPRDRPGLHRRVVHPGVLLEGGLGEEDLHQAPGGLRDRQLAEDASLVGQPRCLPRSPARAPPRRRPAAAPGSGRGSSPAPPGAPAGSTSPRPRPFSSSAARASRPAGRAAAARAGACRSASSRARCRATWSRSGAGTTSSTSPSLQRLAGLHRPRGADHVERRLHPHQPRQPLGAAGAGDDAELRLRQAEPGARVVGGDAPGAGDRPLQPAAQADAVDGRPPPASGRPPADRSATGRRGTAARRRPPWRRPGTARCARRR